GALGLPIHRGCPARRVWHLLHGSYAFAFSESLELLQQTIELFIGESIEIHKPGTRTLNRPQQLVQLDVERLGIPDLRVLQQKDHQERDDRGTGVDHQLPAVRKIEVRTRK